MKTISTHILKIFENYFVVINFTAILIIVSVGYYFLLSPAVLRLRVGQNIGFQERKGEEARLSDYLSALESMRLDYQNLTAEKLEQLKFILPKEEDFPGLFVQMQKLAGENNFVLESLEISHLGTEAQSQVAPEETTAESEPLEKKSVIGEISGGRIKELNMAFSISGGNYEDLKNFLQDIEKNLRIFDIYDIRFGSVIGGPFLINVRTYYLIF